MTHIQVNLKRFDIPRAFGGICPEEDASRWITAVLDDLKGRDFSKYGELEITIFPPESLLLSALEALRDSPQAPIKIGAQGIFFKDVVEGGNFGAFTTRLPAAAAASIGCPSALIGHSEERQAYADIFGASCTNYDQSVEATNTLLADSVGCAAARGLRVTYCIGETAEERGSGDSDSIMANLSAVLRRQIVPLAGRIDLQNLVIAYEPRWAIGPGKTPPAAEEIEKIVATIKQICRESLGAVVPVLYGGGLKAENSEAIGALPNLDGGLIALTKFTGQIGFDPEEMEKIVELFMRRRNGEDA